jgi:hypothetical protein
MRSALEEQVPDFTSARLDLFIATLVIENNLGKEWVSRHIDGNAVRPSPGNYLRCRPSDSMERHEHYVRVMELGRRIFELGQEHFAQRLIQNLQRRDLEGAAFEADVVRMLIALPLVVDLREERGTKGDDYDIDLWVQPSRRWPIEVKTRDDDAPYSDKALSRTLGRARSQLPPDHPGMVFLKVPTSWLGDGTYRRNYSDVVNSFLRGTGRVHAVVLVWDAWTPKTFGTGFNWKRDFRTFRTRDVDDSMGFVLDALSEFWSAPWDIGPIAPF